MLEPILGVADRQVKLVDRQFKHYSRCMSVFDEFGKNLRKSSQQWLQWAQKHAQDLGESSLRQIERQDLLTEKQRLHTEVGKRVVEAFLEKGQKTIRQGSTQIANELNRLAAIDERLEAIEAEEAAAAAQRESQRAEKSEKGAGPSTNAATPRQLSEGSSDSDGFSEQRSHENDDDSKKDR
jgi:hypothetical protein